MQVYSSGSRGRSAPITAKAEWNMRKLIAYTLSAACLVWAASAGAQSDPRGVQPIPRRITGDDGSPTGGPAGDGVPALNAGLCFERWLTWPNAS